MAAAANAILNRDLSSSLVVPDNEGEAKDVENTKEPTEIVDKKVVWGLYCVYFIIGTINGFFATYFAVPTVCQYVFGPCGDGPNDHTTFAQCNVAPSVYQISWNFKLFFGIFLDLVPFFRSRRKGWMIFGWTGGLGMLAVVAYMADDLHQKKDFETYMYLMMIMCVFSTFSDVAGDGMIIEISKNEPEDKKGYILTTCQMMRFVMMMVSTGIGTLFWSGKSYLPPNQADDPPPGTLILPFELSFAGMHWLLLAVSVPFYIGMWVWLKDPPEPEGHKHGCAGLKEAAEKFWKALKSYAIFNLLIQAVGIQAIAAMMNPANNQIIGIAGPTNIQSGIGSFLGNLLFVNGVWVFRKFFLNKNWRITLCFTQGMVAVCSALAVMIVYDVGGFSRNGWFYMFQANIPLFIQGVGQVVSSLAVIEVSPPGLEATIYELLTSAFNGAISLGAVLQTAFGHMFKLDDISADRFFHDLAHRPEMERKLATATIFALVVNLTGALVFMWFLPKNAAQCREWRDRKSWHLTSVAIVNLVIFLGPYAYANYGVLAAIAGGN